MSRDLDSAGAKVPKPQELIIGWQDKCQETGVRETSTRGSALHLTGCRTLGKSLPCLNLRFLYWEKKRLAQINDFSNCVPQSPRFQEVF